MAYEDLTYEKDCKFWQLIGKANELYGSDNIAEYIKVCKQALRIDPNNNYVLVNLSSIFLKLGLDNEAEKYTSKAFELYQGVDEYTIVNYSCTLIDKKKYNEAIEILEICKSKDSQDHLVYNNLGFSYFLKGQYFEALDNYTISIAIEEKNSHAYCNRGILKYFVFKDNGGIQDLIKAEKYGDMKARIILIGLVKSQIN
jgi:tetratricopeptide (TPR) repeat protein